MKQSLYTRRRFVASSAALSLLFSGGAYAQSSESDDIAKWMETWMSQTKAIRGTLHISRFVEPVYYLTKPTVWLPNADQKYQSVTVPVGFVTDFASIPRVFWSMLRPDGEYTHAAILHDYLYWNQATSREVADEIFYLAMEDFKISKPTASTIYSAVRAAGASSWNSNQKAKAGGEKRILKIFPDDPLARWSDWKKRTDVFQ